jgi:hypothetical protein
MLVNVKLEGAGLSNANLAGHHHLDFVQAALEDQPQAPTVTVSPDSALAIRPATERYPERVRPGWPGLPL